MTHLTCGDIVPLPPQNFLKNQSEAAAKEKKREAQQAKAAVSGSTSSLGGAATKGCMADPSPATSSSSSSASPAAAMSQEEAMRRLVQGGAPVMVLELQATGPGLPQPAGIKVAVTIWSASHGETDQRNASKAAPFPFPP